MNRRKELDLFAKIEMFYWYYNRGLSFIDNHWRHHFALLQNHIKYCSRMFSCNVFFYFMFHEKYISLDQSVQITLVTSFVVKRKDKIIFYSGLKSLDRSVPLQLSPKVQWYIFAPQVVVKNDKNISQVQTSVDWVFDML